MDDLISRQAVLDAIEEIESEVVDGDGFQYEKWRHFFCELPSVNLQPTCNQLATDKISQFIDGLERGFADIRERFIDDSVCGLCEYDGAYVGQSGDWCNECPGFEKDDCFKLSDKTRKKWTEEIIKALDMVPSAELQPTCNKIATSCNQLATDCIRRGDAIDAIESHIRTAQEPYVLQRADEIMNYAFEVSASCIYNLPSADIDLSDYSDRLWRNAYEQGKADAEPRWIPCERELPELATYVLVSHVGTVFVDCLTMENGDLLFWETGVFLAEEIRNLAWMPLPEPWKGEADAETD